MCGGLTKSQLFVQTTADILGEFARYNLPCKGDSFIEFISGLPVCIPREKESVLLGSAILGANASKYFGVCSLDQVAQKLAGPVDTFSPNQHLKE